MSQRIKDKLSIKNLSDKNFLRIKKRELGGEYY